MQAKTKSSPWALRECLFERWAQITNHMQRRHQKFSKQGLFVGQRYRRIENQNCSLCLVQSCKRAN